jgi:hypothetical protein
VEMTDDPGSPPLFPGHLSLHPARILSSRFRAILSGSIVRSRGLDRTREFCDGTSRTFWQDNLLDNQGEAGSNSAFGLAVYATALCGLHRGIYYQLGKPLPLFEGHMLMDQGVAPTLVFPIPTHGPWSVLFKSPRDYYPFWSLTCESF